MGHELPRKVAQPLKHNHRHKDSSTVSPGCPDKSGWDLKRNLPSTPINALRISISRRSQHFIGVAINFVGGENLQPNDLHRETHVMTTDAGACCSWWHQRACFKSAGPADQLGGMSLGIAHEGATQLGIHLFVSAYRFTTH